VWVEVENDRAMATRTAWDVDKHISPPAVVTLEGANATAISSGRVTDQRLRIVEPSERRPARYELDSVRGRSVERVQFIVEGSGPCTVTVDSARGGVLSREFELPGRE